MNVILVLVLVLICTSDISGKYHHQDDNRTCIPAEAEPMLNSSSCYPLVNFTRPFCENHGVRLPNYVYATPLNQYGKNDKSNKFYGDLVKFGAARANYYLKINITTYRKCMQNVIILFCHKYFPSCDRTQNIFKETKICRKSCLELLSICGRVTDIFLTFYSLRFPEHADANQRYFHCKTQPHRNAGDSPECWYFNKIANITDTPQIAALSTKANCLYFNGSSYCGNISVTASGITCQSWTKQCPHRHNMNTTYPELNDAKNYCRNPQNSGKRPWCFTTDRNKRWEYCNVPKCVPVDGSYGNWSLYSKCNATCGKGFETWWRACNNPKPKYGGKNCSHIGKAIAYKECSFRPCPINGGYGNWTLSIPCNVSCGNGTEIWRRACNNPVPKYGGHNCSGLGNSTESRNCSRTPCSIHCNCGNWTKFLSCSVTCGEGVKIWTRQCDNPPDIYGGNCSRQGLSGETRICNIRSCPVQPNFEVIGIAAGVGVAVVIVIVAVCYIFVRQRRRRKQDSPYYAVLNFSLQHLFVRNRQLPENNRSTSDEGTSSSQEMGSSVAYQNLTSEGNPEPGFSRGVVHYVRNYLNTRPLRNSWYNKVQLIRPLTIEWLRNSWGNVDEFGRHVYDTMERALHIVLPYDKLSNVTQGESIRNGIRNNSNTYNTMARSPAAILPFRSECSSTAENI